MFEKTTPSTPPQGPMRTGAATTSLQRARPLSGPPTILGPHLSFDGRISGDGELHIDGAFKGDVEVAKVIVGENGTVEGSISGGEVEVRGRVTGNIQAQVVTLLASGHVDGDITHEQLAVEVGAYFQGRCQQVRPTPRRDAESERKPGAPIAAAAMTPTPATAPS